jgi:hypothetical protein
MNTKRFDVEYSDSRLTYTELILRACISTDNAVHYATVRMGGRHGSYTDFWAGGRSYTPQQKSKVLALFDQVEPDVWATIDKYLKSHKYPSVDELESTDMEIEVHLDSNHRIDTFIVRL